MKALSVSPKRIKKQNQAQKNTNLFSMAETSSSNNGSSSSSPITKIPQDHLFSILLLLPTESILCFAMTCKKLKSMAYSDSLWEFLCKRDWGQTPVYDNANRLPWKRLYQQLYQLDSVYCRKLLAESSSPDGDKIVPSPRASHSLNLVSGCLVLFGGGSEGGRHLDDTWVAHIGNPSQTTLLNWQKTNLGIPSGRFGHSCVVLNNSLVLFGGINDHGIRQNDTWLGQVTLHHESRLTLSWRLLDVGSIAPPPRGAHAGCHVGNKRMLIHGGIGPSGVRLGDTWILDLSEDLNYGSWREIVTRPNPPSRSGHTLTHIGEGKTILFGGRGLGYEVLNDVWILDSCEGRWRWTQVFFELNNNNNMGQGFPLPRVGHSANLILGRRLLIYGGEDSYRNRKDDFWVLDVSSMGRVGPNGMFRKMWKKIELKGDEPNCRSFHGACVDGSGRFLYVYGGMVDGLLQPADPSGLRFDGECFVVELGLQS